MQIQPSGRPTPARGSAVRAAAIGALCFLVPMVSCTVIRPSSEGADAVFSYPTGNLSTIIETDLDTAYAAAQGAVVDMGFSEQSKDLTDEGAEVKAAAPGAREVDITLAKKNDTSTKITVGVGPFGPQSLAHDTLDRILERIR